MHHRPELQSRISHNQFGKADDCVQEVRFGSDLSDLTEERVVTPAASLVSDPATPEEIVVMSQPMHRLHEALATEARVQHHAPGRPMRLKVYLSLVLMLKPILPATMTGREQGATAKPTSMLSSSTQIPPDSNFKLGSNPIFLFVMRRRGALCGRNGQWALSD